jgi:hypothetical protein
LNKLWIEPFITGAPAQEQSSKTEATLSNVFMEVLQSRKAAIGTTAAYRNDCPNHSRLELRTARILSIAL